MPEQVLTSSRLWAEAAGIAPVGKPWTGADTHCIMCGAEVKKGDVANPLSSVIDNQFNGKLDCHTPGEAICGHCYAVKEDKLWRQAFSKAYAVAGQGIYVLRTKEDIASFVISPPSRPYVAIWNVRQQAHMVFRTPVALPNTDILTLRLDDSIVVIDRKRVLAAVEAWQRAGAALTRAGYPKSSAYLLSWDMQSVDIGKPIKKYRDILLEAGLQSDVALLDSLTADDWWALCACRDFPCGTPVPPRRDYEDLL